MSETLDEIHERLCCDSHYLHHVNTPSVCWTCREVATKTLANLASCLAVAGALCEAFDLGREQNEHERLYSSHGYRTDQDWLPGCGRPAHTHSEEESSNG
jgi:hypothetical protein